MILFGRRQAASVLLCAVAVVALCPPAAAQPEPVDGPVLDPSSPLEPLPDLGIDWPDLSEEEQIAPSLEPAPQTTQAPAAEPSTLTDAEAVQRYVVALDGLEGLDAAAIQARFDALSTLRQGESSPSNTAQIDRRAREDEKLLRELLRAEGYYDANVFTRVDPDEGRIVVRLRVDPGTLYRFSEVRVEGLAGDAAPLRDAFTVAENDPVKAIAVLAATSNLRDRLGNSGYPFASVPDPSITIDHAERAGQLLLPVETGPFARFGAVELRGRPPFSARHVQRIARFRPGDTYNIADLEDLRRALIATGLVSSVTLTPQKTPDPAVVDIAVNIERAPPRTIAGELGYGTDEGIRLGVSWTHRNLIRPEGAVTFRGVAGTREQNVGASLRRSNFRKRDQVLTGQVSLSHIDREAFSARTFSISAGLERQTNIIWQKKWTWSVGAEVLASDERDSIVATGDHRRRTFYIAAAPLTLAYDGSDDLLDPTRGFRLAGRLSPEVSFHSGTLTYARAQIDTSFYQPVGSRTVIAARSRLGTLAGAERDQVAPSRRYYAGGGGSVRGYGYQDIGPRDAANDPIGGRSIAEFSLESRIRFGDFGAVAFVDAGNIYTSSIPKLTDLRFGAGVGVRYYAGFGPIRVDVGTPLNRRPGDARVAVYVSLGQAF